MYRIPSRRVALTSSLALLLGAGLPIEQTAAQAGSAHWSHPPRALFDADESNGFELAPAPAAPPPARTPETPGAGGFELLPPSAGADASSSASASSLGPVELSSAVEPTAAPEPLTMRLPGAQGFELSRATPDVRVQPTPETPGENGFELLPASASVESVEPTSAHIEAPGALSRDGSGFTLTRAAAAAPGNDFEFLTASPALQPIAVAPSVDVAAPQPAAHPAPSLQQETARARVKLVAGAPTLVFEKLPDNLSGDAVKPMDRVETLTQPEAPRLAGPLILSRAAADQAMAAKITPLVDGGFELLPATPAADAVEASAEAPTAAPSAPKPIQLAQADQSSGFETTSAPAPAPAADSSSGFEVTPASAPAPAAPAADSGGFETTAASPAPAASSGSTDFETTSAPASQQASAAQPDLVSSPAPAPQVQEAAAEPPPAPPPAPEPQLQAAAQPQPAAAEAAPPPPPPAETPPAPTAPSLPEAPAAQPSPAPVIAAPESPPAAPASTPDVPAPAPTPAVQTAATPAAEPPAAAAAPAPPPIEHPLAVVSRIIVQGNERIEASTVLSYLPIAPGDAIDAARIDLAVKTLFRTDLFADVSIELQGTDLVVKVSENPIINQVVFEGNHALKEDKLRDEVGVRPRGIFTRSKVEQDVQKIIELYRRSGRISVTVTPKIIQLPQKRVDLIFEIEEGPKSGIIHINFIGNKAYGDNALRDVIVTRESHWYKFFQSNDNYDPDRIEYDREQLRKFYRNHGFYDFRVISGVAELAPDKNGFVVTFTIDEGPKYHFGKLKVDTQLKRLNGELLQALLPIRPGQLYEDDRIEKATDSLTYAAGANGFAFVDVRPRYVAHPETKTVDVTFDIREGPRVYIERIDVVGNTRTLDYVIRREMRVAEGDAYNRVLVDRSKNQIRALGFFKDVDIEQIPGSAPDKTVLRVKVEEQPTGQLTFSLGYSSVEKLVGDVGISEANFRGRGQKVDFQVSMGYLRKQVQLSFTEPRFMGRNLSAGFDVYTYRYNFSDQASFTSSSTGLNLRTGFPINQYASIGTRYVIHTDKVEVPSYIIDPTTGKCLAGYSQSLCDEVGTTLTSAVGYTVRWDRRNDPIIPTRGFYVDFSQDFAGVGGNVNYVRTSADGAWYYGFTPKWIFSVQGTAGYISGWGGDIVRINDRWFKGGDSFRGFEIAGIGPRDTSLVSTTGSPIGDALGGKLFAIGTVELTVPTPIPQQYGIKTALFSDFGTLGLLDGAVKRNPNGTIDPNIRDNLALRASAGVSVFWKSPMGPLRFDFSKVLKKAPYDRTETFRFTTATQFY